MLTANANRPTGAIRSARKAAGLSQEQLAQRAGCSTAYVRVLEGGYAPDPDASPVYAQVLDVLNDERRPAEAAAVKEPRRQARHDAG